MKLKESDDDEELEVETEETEETEDSKESADDDEEEEAAETDNVGDASVEINVEELIHEVEVKDSAGRLGGDLAARRRLEELMEQKRAKRDLEDFDDYQV